MITFNFFKERQQYCEVKYVTVSEASQIKISIWTTNFRRWYKGQTLNTLPADIIIRQFKRLLLSFENESLVNLKSNNNVNRQSYFAELKAMNRNYNLKHWAILSLITPLVCER